MQAPQGSALQQQLMAAQQLEMLFADPKSIASQTVATYTELLDGMGVRAVVSLPATSNSQTS